MGLQAALHLVYPPRCMTCDTLVERDFALCGPCWRATPFIFGLVCDRCGVPLPGEDDGSPAECDACMASPPPWSRGRAAFAYRDNGRRIVLALKHGDRLELARGAAGWLARAAVPLIGANSLIVPIPIHRWRLVRRRYNQAALLALHLSERCAAPVCADALIRIRPTPVQDGLDREARFANLQAAIAPHPRRGSELAGRDVVLVDDVMTSGATFAAATAACFRAGATSVSTLALARVAKEA